MPKKRILLMAAVAVGFAIVKPTHAAQAPIVSVKEKQKFLIAQMAPKEYAHHLIKQEWRNADGEFKCLRALWGKESAWNHKAKSPTHDYGIPQRNMKHNNPKQIRDFLKDPQSQIRWGLGYIKHRYDSPCGALKAWLSRADKNGRGGWY